MKHNVKRWISLFLVLSTLLSLGILPVSAIDEPPVKEAEGVVYNPLYTSHVPVTEAVEEVPAEDETMALTYLGLEGSAQRFRDEMIIRKTAITIYLYDPEGDIYVSDIFDLAISEELANSPTAGDYLRWSWSNWYTGSWSYMGNGNWQVTVFMDYYSYSNQELWFLEQLEVVMDSLPLAGKTDYEKYRTIYQYICDTVNYDYAGLDALNDDYTYNDDYYIFTAYACLARGKAVCQGYACLFYAMCRSAGLPVRIVTSIDHAWNIVKLNGIWYNVDSTWDGQDPVTTWDWFLLGSRSFDSSHPREAGYEDWDQTHPMSKYDYHACTGSHIYETRKVTKQPTCTATGTSADICYYCGRGYNATSIAALGHNYQLTLNQTATATEAGIKVYTCSRCSKTTTSDHTPAYGTGNPFVDVHSGSFYYNPVQWAVGNDITKGVSAAYFEPDSTCTRGQVVTFLWRACGSPEPKSNNNPFTDVAPGRFYYKAVLWAVENGITSGVTKTTFDPDAQCTRGQVVTFLYRTAGKPTVTNTSHNFTDVRSGAFYYKAMLWAVGEGITSGTSKTKFSPDAPCTRGQVVTFLYRYCN